MTAKRVVTGVAALTAIGAAVVGMPPVATASTGQARTPYAQAPETADDDGPEINPSSGPEVTQAPETADDDVWGNPGWDFRRFYAGELDLEGSADEEPLPDYAADNNAGAERSPDYVQAPRFTGLWESDVEASRRTRGIERPYNPYGEDNDDVSETDDDNPFTPDPNPYGWETDDDLDVPGGE